MWIRVVRQQNWSWMKEAKKCKILMLGESAVGKTSLFSQYVNEKEALNSSPTIGVQYKQKLVELEDSTLVKVQLWDTAGTERFRTITPAYYRNVDGFMLVFDITDQPSFQQIQFWVDQLKQKAEEDVQIILVGNKNDQENKRTVSKSAAQAKAKDMGVVYCETNAKNYQDTKPAFEFLIYSIFKAKSRIQKNKEMQGSTTTRASNVIKLHEPQKASQKRENEDCC